MQKLLLTVINCFILLILSAQIADKRSAVRSITVRDGLPQSYVSGIVQDDNGFLWVSTLNGLGRYDGRGFRNYYHPPSDSGGISSNIILHMFKVKNDAIWLMYDDGRIDELNTGTEAIVPVWKKPGFEVFRNEVENFKTLTSYGRYVWMMSRNGGVYRIDQQQYIVTHFNLQETGSYDNQLGLATYDGKLLLFTAAKLFIYNDNGTLAGHRPYPFGKIAPFKSLYQNRYSPLFRTANEIVLRDAQGLKIWNIETDHFITVALHTATEFKALVGAFDEDRNLYFQSDTSIYQLTTENKVTRFIGHDPLDKAIPVTIHIDKSGVCWVGTNGFGLRQYNLRKTGAPGYMNDHSFVMDVLENTGASLKQMKATFLSRAIPFANRSALQNDSLWICDVYLNVPGIRLVLYTGKSVLEKKFIDENKLDKRKQQQVKFLSVNGSNNLWGINQYFELVKFDMRKGSFSTYPAVAATAGEIVNGLASANDSGFYISTNKNLYQFSPAYGRSQTLTSYLPSKDLLHITADKHNANILWIGTLSDGIIRFDLATKQCRVFSTATGLPNNTIYSIIPGKDGQLWCSSNKGIFAFNTTNHTVRSFTLKDGLTDDEFNRFYYMQLPGEWLAFGGPSGYTVFDPATMQADSFHPKINITGISINSKIYSDGLSFPSSLELVHTQNFITVSFAAMQFDAPEKLQYRYQLEGLDKDWIMAGNNNFASYTSIPPGNYRLIINATNTDGKWSRHFTYISFHIHPPFWKTWWFYTLLITCIAIIIYGLVKLRLDNFRKQQLQQLSFERQAMELQSVALRAQMDPHFIFNCMNSIKAMIQQGRDKDAVIYLTKFSSLLRKLLGHKGIEVTLKEELDTCKTYLDLESMRFENRISYTISIESDDLLEIRIPPLILQPVVENAVVHGLLPLPGEGSITITVKRDNNYCVCTIADNGIGRTAAEAGKKSNHHLHRSEGLHLLKERIAVNNRMYQQENQLIISDVLNNDGDAAGTLVTIKFYINS